MGSQTNTDFIEFNAGGFELYLPPSPMLHKQEGFEARPPFVMLDDINDMFYNVNFERTKFNRNIPYVDLELHTVQDPAIVFQPNQWNNFEQSHTATGFLVSIFSREGGVCSAKILGLVNVQPLKQEAMNWAALRSKKGPELPTEMKGGLLRHVWNRRANANTQSIPYQHQKNVLDKMSNPWHRDGNALNYELDQLFAGGLRLPGKQKWRLYAEQP